MSDLKVSDVTVPGVLDALKKGEWRVPEFQREFVWTTDQVSGLVQSILEARPIGMVTLWEQTDAPQIALQPISIADLDADTKKTKQRYFGPQTPGSKSFAVLDGRQRCTAIAMAFGGFRAIGGQYRYSGRYYLNVTEPDPRKRVKYLKDSDVRKQKLDIDATCVSRGLFPLASNIEGESVLTQWMRYLQALERAENYTDSVMPSKEDLAQRNSVLQEAFEGIVSTKLAVYTVPAKYDLADICDIFETLNTTGTKVSTVDLIHSWLYSDTSGDSHAPFLLREWIADLGQKDGAIGWAVVDERPELIAQFVTAAYVALVDRPTARNAGFISGIKSADLLSTPTPHWRSIRENEDLFASFIGNGQRVVADGTFPYSACPYPATMAIYVALRWHAKFDLDVTHPWSIDALDALFRAFFWRTALTRRYDQGFLSQVGTDITDLKAILQTEQKHPSTSKWAAVAEAALQKIIKLELPAKEEMVNLLTNGNQGGALQKALMLPLIGRAKSDLVDSTIKLSYPMTNVELHHIYPKDWCRNNRIEGALDVLDPAKAGRDYAGSVVNLMPLSRTSNNSWKQKHPAQFISEKKLSYVHNQGNLAPLFIDEPGFKWLSAGDQGVKAFWDHRADLMADDLLRRMRVIL
jgi:hypothetical protein